MRIASTVGMFARNTCAAGLIVRGFAFVFCFGCSGVQQASDYAVAEQASESVEFPSQEAVCAAALQVWEELGGKTSSNAVLIQELCESKLSPLRAQMVRFDVRSSFDELYKSSLSVLYLAVTTAVVGHGLELPSVDHQISDAFEQLFDEKMQRLLERWGPPHSAAFGLLARIYVLDREKVTGKFPKIVAEVSARMVSPSMYNSLDLRNSPEHWLSMMNSEAFGWPSGCGRDCAAELAKSMMTTNAFLDRGTDRTDFETEPGPRHALVLGAGFSPLANEAGVFLMLLAKSYEDGIVFVNDKLAPPVRLLDVDREFRKHCPENGDASPPGHFSLCDLIKAAPTNLDFRLMGKDAKDIDKEDLAGFPRTDSEGKLCNTDVYLIFPFPDTALAYGWPSSQILTNILGKNSHAYLVSEKSAVGPQQGPPLFVSLKTVMGPEELIFSTQTTGNSKYVDYFKIKTFHGREIFIVSDFSQLQSFVTHSAPLSYKE